MYTLGYFQINKKTQSLFIDILLLANYTMGNGARARATGRIRKLNIYIKTLLLNKYLISCEYFEYLFFRFHNAMKAITELMGGR